MSNLRGCVRVMAIHADGVNAARGFGRSRVVSACFDGLAGDITRHRAAIVASITEGVDAGHIEQQVISQATARVRLRAPQRCMLFMAMGAVASGVIREIGIDAGPVDSDGSIAMRGIRIIAGQSQLRRQVEGNRQEEPQSKRCTVSVHREKAHLIQPESHMPQSCNKNQAQQILSMQIKYHEFLAMQS